MERVCGLDRVGTVLGHNIGDVGGAVGGDVGDLGATFRAEEVEEALQRRFRLALPSPHQPAGVVVDDNHQKQATTTVGDLIDPDFGQPAHPVHTALNLSPDPADHRPHRAPRDPHQLSHRVLRGLRRQPGDLFLEDTRRTSIVARPGHMRDHHPMLATLDPWRLTMETTPDRAQIQSPPVTTPSPRVVPGCRTHTASTPIPAPHNRPNSNRHHQRPRVEVDPLNDGVLDPNQRPP